MSVKVKSTCPLGHSCERISKNVLERCAWLVTLEGNNPQTDEPMNETKCAIAWEPILLVEGNRESFNVNRSVQSLRNENVKRQDLALEIIGNAKIASDK